MNVVLGLSCADIGYAGPGKPPEDGEMIEMKPSTLPLGHGGFPQD